MRLLIYELLSTGGIAGDRDLAAQGFAMLDAVLEDFAAVPGLDLATVLGDSLRCRAAASGYAGRVAITWSSGEGRWAEDFAIALRQCDGALVIAPETDGLLTTLTVHVENCGKFVLGSTAAATALAGNKACSLMRLRQAGLPVPRSAAFSPTGPPDWRCLAAAGFTPPVVVKPVDGTSCLGLTLAADEASLKNACHKVAEASRQPVFLVQEYISGEPASVSCLVTAGRALPVSVNRQLVDSGANFCFKGITVPYSHPQAAAAKSVAKRACEAIAGLSGFVGVDVVFGPSGPVIMEINPRITVAYIALRRVVGANLAAELCRLPVRGLPPQGPEITGSYTYLID